ncbi:hypothetical protein COU60_00210 [Candidatus Pacearchaeota archaeon CG10_big_fil_rev_8_21_14_0_10_34_76]|nr:MAG: hypothetical protein COU60_00210 [Candidatus Pacearchaeota archaeon CG10_big_fil_rev_8_21_14_0_10_34_76]
MEKTKLNMLKGGHENMKIVGIAIMALLVVSMFTVGVLAQKEEVKKERIEFIAASSGASVSASEAIGIVPPVAEANDVSEIINEIDSRIGPEFRKLGFVKISLAEGYFTSGDHLGLVRALWGQVNVVSVDDAEASNPVTNAFGKIRVDNVVYSLVKESFSDDEISFTLIGRGTDSTGTLDLRLEDSYDDETRQIWKGEIKTEEYAGDISLVSVNRPIKRVSNENANEREVPIGRFDGTSESSAVSDGYEAAQAEDSSVTEASDNPRGFFGWFKRTFGNA